MHYTYMSNTKIVKLFQLVIRIFAILFQLTSSVTKTRFRLIIVYNLGEVTSVGEVASYNVPF